MEYSDTCTRSFAHHLTTLVHLTYSSFQPSVANISSLIVALAVCNTKPFMLLALHFGLDFVNEIEYHLCIIINATLMYKILYISVTVAVLYVVKIHL